MIIANKTVIRGNVATWNTVVPDATHWFARIENTENGECYDSGSYSKYDDAYKWIAATFLAKCDPFTHILLICSKAAFLSMP